MGSSLESLELSGFGVDAGNVLAALQDKACKLRTLVLDIGGTSLRGVKDILKILAKVLPKISCLTHLTCALHYDIGDGDPPTDEQLTLLVEEMTANTSLESCQLDWNAWHDLTFHNQLKSCCIRNVADKAALAFKEGTLKASALASTLKTMGYPTANSLYTKEFLFVKVVQPVMNADPNLYLDFFAGRMKDFATSNVATTSDPC